jgi:excisionase family DNA binding protein
VSLGRVPGDAREDRARMVPKDMMTAKEASVYLSMDEATVTRMAAERRIPSMEVDGVWVFSKKSIDKWRRQQEQRDAGR